VLLLFVGASLGIGLMDSVRPTDDPATTASVSPVGERNDEGKLIAYYFHGAHRCDTCRTIEAFAHAALAPSIEQKELEWRIVNYDLPANKALSEEFKVVGPTLVLARADVGGQNHWKNLIKVWDYTDDKSGFVEYVRGELVRFQESPHE
jgi:hypothetical protein